MHELQLLIILFQTTLVETNPYLLALTVIVSLVHSVFEFLAFKNGELVAPAFHVPFNSFLLQVLAHRITWASFFLADIQFWRNRKSLEGLSVRSVFFNVFQSLVVLLYVLDNETNFVVRISVFIGLGIELWKIHKVIDVKVRLRLCLLHKK